VVREDLNDRYPAAIRRAVDGRELQRVGRVDVRAALEEQPGGVDVAEKACEPQRVEAVVTEGIRERRVLRQQLAEAVGITGRCCLENGQRRVLGEQLLGAGAIAAVQGLQ
jgi:hypothetical protein